MQEIDEPCAELKVVAIVRKSLAELRLHIHESKFRDPKIEARTDRNLEMANR